MNESLKGLGKWQKKILAGFEQSPSGLATITEILLFLTGQIENYDTNYVGWPDGQFNELDFDFSDSMYKSTLRSLSTLEKRGLITRRWYICQAAVDHSTKFRLFEVNKEAFRQ